MNIQLCFAIFLPLIIVSVLLTGFICRVSSKGGFYDIPNERSSHHKPTPKGGGITIVLTILICILLLYFNSYMDLNLFVSLFVGITIISVTGFIDDYKNLSVLIRAIIYFMTSVFSLTLIGGFSSISIDSHFINLGWFGSFLGVIFIVWMTNLYNFMDGTDGFAGVQTIFVSLFSIFLLYFSPNLSICLILICLASSTMGFLYWNWPPAKIFMGDVGSCTIGFLFGLLAIYSDKQGIISFAVWLIMLSPFFGDATFTLIRRMVKREKWYRAHNSHAYQKIYQLGVSHHKLAVCLIITHIIIVWPLAYIAHTFKNFETIMLLLTYSIIGIIWMTVQNQHTKKVRLST